MLKLLRTILIDFYPILQKLRQNGKILLLPHYLTPRLNLIYYASLNSGFNTIVIALLKYTFKISNYELPI